MLGVTHLFVGLALAYLLDLPVVYGMVGAVLPDIDATFTFAEPFTHRGIVHTPIAAVALALALYLVLDRRPPALAFGTGYLSHLFLDTFTYSGIMWLFPLTTTYTLGATAADGFLANVGIALFAASATVTWHRREVIAGWT